MSGAEHKRGIPLSVQAENLKIVVQQKPFSMTALKVLQICINNFTTKSFFTMFFKLYNAASAAVQKFGLPFKLYFSP